MKKIEIYNCLEYDIDCGRLKTEISAALSTFKMNSVSLEINFVSREEILHLNQDFRGKDSPTDVLSFPQIKIPNEKIRVLGNIIISPEICKLKEEDIFEVTKHGLLHLLGYDHDQDLSAWQEAANLIDCKF